MRGQTNSYYSYTVYMIVNGSQYTTSNNQAYHWISGLTYGQTYSIAMKIVDSRGLEATSSTVNVTISDTEFYWYEKRYSANNLPPGDGSYCNP